MRVRLVIPVSLLLAAASCSDGPTVPQVGNIEVVTSTTVPGLDEDGYIVLLDGSDQRQAAVNGMLTYFDVPVGRHSLYLSGLAPACALINSNPQVVTVGAGETATASFNIGAAEPGQIEVTVATSGTSIDHDGYRISVADRSWHVPTNGVVSLDNILPGDHDVWLEDRAANCSLQGDNPQPVRVASGSLSRTSFDLTCVELPTVEGNWNFSITNLVGSYHGSSLTCTLYGSVLSLRQVSNEFSGSYSIGTLTCQARGRQESVQVMGTIVNGRIDVYDVEFDMDTSDAHCNGTITPAGLSMDGTTRFLVDMGDAIIDMSGNWAAARTGNSAWVGSASRLSPQEAIQTVLRKLESPDPSP